MCLAAATALAAVLTMAQPANAVTTGHTGSGRPGVAVVGSTLYLAWTGSTDRAGGKALNFGLSTNGGTTITKLTNNESSLLNEGPALNSVGTGVYMAWTGSDSAHTLTMDYFNGTTFTCKTVFTGVTSPHSPALASDPGTGAQYLAWTDNSGFLNLATVNSDTCATTQHMTLSNRTTVSATSVAGPALVYDTSGTGQGLVVAWSGTDSAHSVNIGSYTGATQLNDQSVVAPSPVAASIAAPGLASVPSDLYVGFQGIDGKYYHAYSEGCQPTCFNSYTDGPVATSGIGLGGNGNIAWVSYFNQNDNLTIARF
jgi:hypothetical protein